MRSAGSAEDLNRFVELPLVALTEAAVRAAAVAVEDQAGIVDLVGLPTTP